MWIIIAIICGLLGYILAYVLTSRKYNDILRTQSLISSFNESLASFQTTNKSLMPFFERKNYRGVIVFCPGPNCNKFLNLIDTNAVDVRYIDFIDNPDNGCESIDKIGSIKGDVIIITVVTKFDEVYRKLRKKGETRPILSLHELTNNSIRETL